MKERKSHTKNPRPPQTVLAPVAEVPTAEERRRLRQSPPIEKVESVPTVTVLIKRPDGSDMGLAASDSRPLAEALEEASKTDGFSVSKREDSLFVGQDIFDSDRAYLFSVCGLLLSPSEVVVWHGLIPEDAKITFFVSY